MRERGSSGAASSCRGARVVAVGLLAVSNVVANGRLPDRWYVPWNVGVAGSLVALARRAGRTWGDLGLGRSRLRAGFALGAAGAAAVAGVYGAAAASGGGRRAFADERITALSSRQAWYQGLVRVPLGTVVLEEVAFRGVLPALFGGSRLQRALPSVLFGLWHVLPSRDLATQNAAVGSWTRRRVTVQVAAVVSMTVAGGVLEALRRRSGSLAAPVLVHAATNVLAVAFARALGSNPRASVSDSAR